MTARPTQNALALFFLAFSVAPGLSYQYVQDRLRPQADESFAALLFGIAPNLLGALSASTAIFVMLLGLMKSASVAQARNLALAAATAGLLAWEGLQLVIPGFTFDPADIAATAAGGLAFFLAAAIIFPSSGAKASR